MIGLGGAIEAWRFVLQLLKSESMLPTVENSGLMREAACDTEPEAGTIAEASEYTGRLPSAGSVKRTWRFRFRSTVLTLFRLIAPPTFTDMIHFFGTRIPSTPTLARQLSGGS